jgi:hypothetical protein
LTTIDNVGDYLGSTYGNQLVFACIDLTDPSVKFVVDSFTYKCRVNKMDVLQMVVMNSTVQCDKYGVSNNNVSCMRDFKFNNDEIYNDMMRILDKNGYYVDVHQYRNSLNQLLNAKYNLYLMLPLIMKNNTDYMSAIYKKYVNSTDPYYQSIVDTIRKTADERVTKSLDAIDKTLNEERNRTVHE